MGEEEELNSITRDIIGNLLMRDDNWDIHFHCYDKEYILRNYCGEGGD